jgi:hypothetical protein
MPDGTSRHTCPPTQPPRTEGRDCRCALARRRGTRRRHRRRGDRAAPGPWSASTTMALGREVGLGMDPILRSQVGRVAVVGIDAEIAPGDLGSGSQTPPEPALLTGSSTAPTITDTTPPSAARQPAASPTRQGTTARSTRPLEFLDRCGRPGDLDPTSARSRTHLYLMQAWCASRQPTKDRHAARATKYGPGP